MAAYDRLPRRLRDGLKYAEGCYSVEHFAERLDRGDRVAVLLRSIRDSDLGVRARAMAEALSK